MSKKGAHHHKKKNRHAGYPEEKSLESVSRPPAKRKLEIVLKCDSAGCAEAVEASIKAIAQPEVDIEILSSGVGAINKSDIFMSETESAARHVQENSYGLAHLAGRRSDIFGCASSRFQPAAGTIATRTRHRRGKRQRHCARHAIERAAGHHPYSQT